MLPLVRAVRQRNPDHAFHMVQRCLSDPSTNVMAVHSRDVKQRSALHWALYPFLFRPNVVTCLLDAVEAAGSSVHLPDAYGVTPLMLAAGLPSDVAFPLTERLLTLGADPRHVHTVIDTHVQSPVTFAVRSGNFPLVRYLVERGADPLVVDPLYELIDGWPPGGDEKDPERVALFDALVAWGADPHDPSPRSFNLMTRALYHNVRPFVQRLLACGVLPTARAHRGNALHTAVFAHHSGSLVLLNDLLQAGGRLDDVLAQGSTLLHSAAAGRSRHAVRFLLAQGISVDARDRQGRTPLMNALLGDKILRPTSPLSTLGLLLRAGADPNATDHRGRRVWECAVTSRNTAPFNNTAFTVVVQTSALATLLRYGLNLDLPGACGASLRNMVDDLEQARTTTCPPDLRSWLVDQEQRLLRPRSFRNNPPPPSAVERHRL